MKGLENANMKQYIFFLKEEVGGIQAIVKMPMLVN